VPGPLALPALAALVAQGAPVDPVLRLAALLRPAEAGRVEAVAGRLRLANRERERLLALVTTPLPMGDAPAQRRALHRLGADLYGDLLRLGEAAGELDAMEAIGLRALAADWSAPAFPLAGADLLALGVAEGPAVGRIMALVRAAWEESDFALDRAACLALARDLARDLTP
jgi:poly(A) polymerase